MSTPPTREVPATGARPSRGVLARRRLVALALLAALVVALVLLGQVVVRAVQPMLAGDAEPGTERSAPPTPEAVGPPQDCDARSLRLSLAPSKDRFTQNEAVELAVTMRHVGARPCLVDGSDAVRQVVVSSGDDVVWSSAHCASGENLLLMSRGDEVSSTVRWDLHGSVEGCEPDQPAVEPGEYTAVVRIAGVEDATSEPVSFTLLGPPTKDEPEGSTKDATDGASADAKDTKDDATDAKDDAGADAKDAKDGATDDASDDASSDAGGSAG